MKNSLSRDQSYMYHSKKTYAADLGLSEVWETSSFATRYHHPLVEENWSPATGHLQSVIPK